MNSRSLPIVRRTDRLGLAPVAAGLVIAGALVAGANADDGVALCPFRRCTGGYCPGCGATRAANRLAHGDLQASWSHHPWVILAMAQVAVVAVVAAALASGTRRLQLRRFAIPLVVTNTALLIGIWIVRLSAGTIPTGWL